MQLFQELDLPQSCDVDAFLCFAKPNLLDGHNFASLSLQVIYEPDTRVDIKLIDKAPSVCCQYLFVSGLNYHSKRSFSQKSPFDVLIHGALR